MPGIMKMVRFSRTTTVHHPETPQLTDGSRTPSTHASLVTPPDHYVGLPGPTPYNINVVPATHSDHGHGYPQVYAPYQYPPHPSHHGSHYPSPPQVYRLSPPRAKSLPPQPSVPSQSSLAIHPYLEYHSRHPAISYDLLDEPSQASRQRYALSSSVLAEPATSPRTHALTIKVNHLSESWKFTVSGSRGYVTVGDVLQRIWTELRLNIAPNEWESLRSSDKARIRETYENRYRRYRSQSMYMQEKAGGVKRVDFLLGKTKFLGLSKTKRGDVWLLSTG